MLLPPNRKAEVRTDDSFQQKALLSFIRRLKYKTRQEIEMHRAKRSCIAIYILLSGTIILHYSFQSSSKSSIIIVEKATAKKVRGKKHELPQLVQHQEYEERDYLSKSVKFPVPSNDSFYNLINTFGATRSMDHYRKFVARKDTIQDFFDIKKRYQPIVKRYGAIILSRQYAFLHIWKCGGTTVEELTTKRQMHLDDPSIQQRKWLGLVRDPIDRFLSAWAECGVRLYKGAINFDGFERISALNWLEGEYDFRVRAFLREVQDYLPPTRSCHTHAFPQVNFMLNGSGYVDEHVKIIGDLSEIRLALEMGGLRLGPENYVARDASDDLVKSYYFQARRDLLSDETLLELCEFYALDYFLFDFDPPEICMDGVGTLANNSFPIRI